MCFHDSICFPYIFSFPFLTYLLPLFYIFSFQCSLFYISAHSFFRIPLCSFFSSTAEWVLPQRLRSAIPSPQCLWWWWWWCSAEGAQRLLQQHSTVSAAPLAPSSPAKKEIRNFITHSPHTRMGVFNHGVLQWCWFSYTSYNALRMCVYAEGSYYCYLN